MKMTDNNIPREEIKVTILIPVKSQAVLPYEINYLKS